MYIGICSYRHKYPSIDGWRGRRWRRRRRCRYTPRILLLRCKWIVPAHQHTAHHIKHRITLSWYSNTKVHFAHLRHSFFPRYFFQVRCVVCFELLEEVGGAALDSKEEQAEEVEERE